MSSKEGAMPLNKRVRWCKIQNKYIEVDRPLVVKAYNSHMGGIDFLDRLISYYRICARTRKWTVRVIMHMFDFAIAAGWVEYRRDQQALKTRKRDILDLLHFREEYAHFLAYGTHYDTSTREESDSDFTDNSSLPPACKKAKVLHPPDVLRTKHVLHLPEFPQRTSKNRCRMPGCSANSARIRCSTCKVYLCIQENRNCFKLYHEL